MIIESEPVLHIVDEAIYFSVPQFVESFTTEPVCKPTLTLLASAYTGLPNILFFDDGSQFRDASVKIYEIHDVEKKSPGTQHHSTLGIGEIHHEPIRLIF